jgi:hypothetical protein
MALSKGLRKSVPLATAIVSPPIPSTPRRLVSLSLLAGGLRPHANTSKPRSLWPAAQWSVDSLSNACTRARPAMHGRWHFLKNFGTGSLRRSETTSKGKIKAERSCDGHVQWLAPVIPDGGLVLAEPGAVVEYIIAKYGKGRLALDPSHPDAPISVASQLFRSMTRFSIEPDKQGGHQDLASLPKFGSESFWGSEIDHQLELGRLRHRQIARP